MRVVVIGGTGHIGGFLVPKLAALGHEVVVATRGRRAAPSGGGWERVTMLQLPAGEGRAAALAEAAPEALIDIVQVDASATYAACRRRCKHFIWCGSLWMLGPPTVVPTPEVRTGRALAEGYQTRMDELEALRARAGRDGVAFTAILPPNIAGPGKVPLEMSGGRSIEVHRAHARGEPVILPAGCNTLIGPCDAEDVAQGFWRAAASRDAAAGEFFNVGSAHALTAPAMVDLLAKLYGVTIPIRPVPMEQFLGEVMPDSGANNHFRFHMCPDIAKARAKLGYAPRHTPESAMARAVEWMRREGLL